jgi:hypothetical protein
MFLGLIVLIVIEVTFWQPQIQIMPRPDFRRIVLHAIWLIRFNGPEQVLIIRFSHLCWDILCQNALIVTLPEITRMQKPIAIRVISRIIWGPQTPITTLQNSQQTVWIAILLTLAGNLQLSITVLFRLHSDMH